MYLVFDVGGTKMRVARSEDCKTFSEPLIVPTPQSFDEGIVKLKELFNQASEGKKPVAVCGGVAGPFNRERDRLTRAPHLPDWAGKPLKAELESLLDLPVFLENDTALVGLGEAVVGAGIGRPIVAYITVSTGVGGVRIVNDHIDVHTNSFEPGHQYIDFSDYDIGQCSCGSYGHLETYVSGTDFLRRFGKRPEEVDSTSEIWDIQARILAFGLANTVVHWTPDMIVLGGSMMKIPGIPLDAVRRHLAELLTIYEHPPLVEKSLLADLGGLHGGLAYLRRKLSLK